MVFLRPVGNGIHHVLPEHSPVGSRFISAAGTVGPVSHIIKAVIIVRHDPVEAGIAVIGVVVYHIHHNAQPAFVQCLHHLLEFLHTDFSVIRICGITAFRRIVVLRVIAPVELRFFGRLVHGGIVIHRLQVHMGDAQVLQVINSRRFSRGVGQAMLSKGQVLARISGRRQLVGKVTHMHFPDHRLVIGADAVSKCIRSETLRIRSSQVNDHTPVAVHADRAGIGIHRFLLTGSSGDRVGIIGSGAAGRFRAPHALFSPDHVQGPVSVTAVTGFKQVQHHPSGSRGPYLEGGPVFTGHSAEIVPVIQIPFSKGFSVKNLGGHRGQGAVAFHLHGIQLRQIQFLPDGNGAGHHFVVQARQGCHFQSLSCFLVGNLYLVQGLDPHSRIQIILDLIQVRDACQCHNSLLVQRFAAVTALVLIRIAGLQVYFRGVPGKLGIAVSVIILAGVSPACSARIGAVPADNKSYLADVFRNVQDHLDPVLTGMEKVTVAVRVREPDPHVAGIIILIIIPVPVEGHLAGSLFPGQGVFLLRAGQRRRRPAQECQGHQQSRQYTSESLHLHSSCHISLSLITFSLYPDYIILPGPLQCRPPEAGQKTCRYPGRQNHHFTVQERSQPPLRKHQRRREKPRWIPPSFSAPAPHPRRPGTPGNSRFSRPPRKRKADKNAE